jgi:hypothetical protein
MTSKLPTARSGRGVVHVQVSGRFACHQPAVRIEYTGDTNVTCGNCLRLYPGVNSPVEERYPGSFVVPIERIADHDDPRVCASCGQRIRYAQAAVRCTDDAIVHRRDCR